MKRTAFALLLAAALAAGLLAGPASAQEPERGRSGPAVEAPPGGGANPADGPGSPPANPDPGPAAGRAEGPPEAGADRPDAYELDLGKVWNVHPSYFRKVFDGAGETEPSGLKAKIDRNLYGAIETKWGPADLLFGNMARFFGASPVLLDREFAVRRSMLYD